MITVTARALEDALSEQGGTVDLSYGIEIEQTAAGTIDYHLGRKNQIRRKSAFGIRMALLLMGFS